MRVIGGEFRSRVLKSLPGLDVRPTPDRLREALFNVLSPVIVGAVFLDVYAGTGAVGIEALSRGAVRAVFIDQSRAAVGVIRENLRSLGAEDRALVRQGKAAVVIPQVCDGAGIVFVDPPYKLEDEYARVLTILGEKPPLLTIAQHASRLTLGESYGELRRTRVLRQGDNSLSFYESRMEASASENK